MKFKIGDRVKYIENTGGLDASGAKIGMEGIVEEVIEGGEIIVTLSIGKGFDFDEDELELIDA